MTVSAGKRIFRQTALDRLSSPDQLDHLAPLTDARGWIALITILIVLLGVLGWGIFGSIPERVQGQGILVSTGGQVLDAMILADGKVAQLSVEQGDWVEKGQRIAAIDQPDLVLELQSAKEELDERRHEKEQLESQFEKEFVLKQKNFQEQTTAQNQIVEAAQRQADYLQATLKKRERLVEQGIISRDKLETIRNDYNKAVQDTSAARNRILELQSDLLSLGLDNETAVLEKDQRIAQAQRLVRELSARLERGSAVLAPTSGRVTELKVFEGAVVQVGMAVAGIATGAEALQAVLFIPTQDGKRIAPDMTVHISPSTVRKEEYGAMIGTITHVSEFPATQEGMLTILQNDNLVSDYTRQGAPYIARVDLDVSASAPSGFRWTSGLGPTIGITPGTTLEAEVTVFEQAPINLIIPFVRKHTGVGFWSDMAD